MRAVVCGFIAASLLSVQIALAEQCAKPVDVSAFEVAGLKTHLMVTALTCSQQDRYNEFVIRFRSELVTHERALHAYFARWFGRRAQQEHDDYITSLANAQSQSGIRQGTLFCKQNVVGFDEVLALPKVGDLAGYAASKSPVQPIEVVACAIQPAGTRTAQARIPRQ